jgi:ABC-type nickel/cobalt efflux system permease component RcnA
VTPGETAKTEAAKQAVILAFGILALLAMWPLYRRMAEQQAQTLRSVHDPSAVSLERMRAAASAAKRWDRVSTVMFRFGPARGFDWAWGRAQAARRAYEAERP